MIGAVRVLMLVALGATSPLAVQRDVRPAPALPSVSTTPIGTAVISGQVVADATGTALAHATIVLIGARTGVVKVASADRDGRFAFDALPADRYTIGASKPPYLGAVAGARRPARPGVPIVLADKVQLDDVVIRLPLSAAISGTVFDQSGQPARSVVTGVVQRTTHNGEVVMVSVMGGTAITDDRGRYRVHGLAPGEYIVSAMPIGGSGGKQLSDQEVDDVLSGRVMPSPTQPAGTTRSAPSYFPGTSRLAEAVGVTVGVGDDRTNVDFRLEAASLSSIEGTVSTVDGSPLPRTTVIVTTVAGSSPLSSGASVTVGPDGRFRVAGQPPGHYLLNARTTGGPPTLTATTVVDTFGNDVASAQLVLRPSLTLTARMAVGTNGTATPPAAGVRFQLTGISAASRSGTGPRVSPTTADGTFTITGVAPDRYVLGGTPFFGASGNSVTWGLASVMVDGADVTDRAISIDAEAPPKDIVVTITDEWQEISGRVTNADGAGISDYTMLVFPVDEGFWLHNSRRIVTAQPASDGRYQLGGPGPAILPAGEYYLAAVTDVSKDEQYDPAFLRSLVAAAIKVTLAPGQKATQDVRVQ